MTTDSENEPSIPDCDDELPGDWRDVSDSTGFRYHWHRGEGYPSIRLSHGGLAATSDWTVEMYPTAIEDSVGDLLRTTHETAEEAGNRVIELMEEYPHEE
jgi:hypothetical protein